jgi:hypothetical protein
VKADDLESANAQLQRRDFTGAASLYLKAINEAPETVPAWEGLLASLAGLGLLDKALALIETRQQRFNDGLAFYFGGLMRMIASGFADIADALISATPDNNLLYVVARYGAGVINLRRQKSQDAADHFAAAGVMAQNFADHFWPHPLLQKIIIEGRQFQDFAKLDALIASDRSEVIAQSGIIQNAADFLDSGDTTAPFVVCAGMNETYLDRFGERAVAEVAIALEAISGAIFHLHIVDPTPALDRKITALRAIAPSLSLGVSTESYHAELQGYGRATYYASARFLRAPEIMAHYRKPLMIVDIDIAKLAHVPHIMARFAGGSYGCFEQAEQLPALICHASIITIGNDPSSARFADLTAKLIARRAATEPFWTLDQMSILIASRFLTTYDENFRAIDLTRATGLAFDDCFASNGNATEKQSMRATRATPGA